MFLLLPELATLSNNVPFCLIYQETLVITTFTTAELKVQSNVKHDNNVTTVPKYPRLNWSDNRACASYCRYFIDCAESLPTINFDGVISHQEAQKVFDSMCGNAVVVMHEACSKVIYDKYYGYRGISCILYTGVEIFKSFGILFVVLKH